MSRNKRSKRVSVRSHPLVQVSLTAWFLIASACGTLLCSCTDSDQSRCGEPSKHEADSPEVLKITNVSFGITQSLYRDYNEAFIQYWKGKTGETVYVQQSHGPSAHQARAVIAGLQADVVTLALAYDIDSIRQEAGLLPERWQSRLPNDSCPYYSYVVFLVRRGNPKAIHGWRDLIQPGISVITPSPKTSGGARWNYLAAYGFALKTAQEGEDGAREFLFHLYRNVPVQSSSSRNAALSFAKHGIGDVLIGWEAEAGLILHEFGGEAFELIMPSPTIRIEPAVCLVDRVSEAHGTRDLAEAYLKHLYSPQGQALVSKNYFRPWLRIPLTDPFWGARKEPEFFTIESISNGWQDAHSVHFRDGGLFDQILSDLGFSEGTSS